MTQSATLLLIGGVVGFVAGVGVERRAATPAAAPAIVAAPSATIAAAATTTDAPPLATIAVPTEKPAFERFPTSSAIVLRVSAATVGAPVRVTGRFADVSEKAAVRGVVAMVENAKVAAAFAPTPGSGFTVDVPSATLLPATHTMTILFSESGAERRIAPSTGFALTSARVAHVPEPGNAKSEGGVDVFARLAEPQAQTRGDVVLDRGGYAVVEGWAYDPAGHRADPDVYVSIDGRTYLAATTGLDRPDVVKALGASYAHVGFQAAVGADGLSAGTHVVSVLAVDATSKRSYAFPQTFHLTVR